VSQNHPFFLVPGSWIGEGRILLSSSPEILRFFTKWVVTPIGRELIPAKQLVELHGIHENIVNQFTFAIKDNNKFEVLLENDTVGIIQGNGMFDDHTVSWEFRGQLNFEGFEIYRLEENGDYMVHAEYISTDSHRTTIDGRIWHKGS
jgi:hypothetical protein